MFWRLACCAAMLVGRVWAQDQAAALHDGAVPAEEPAVYEEVLVSGEQPGPGLWRISHGDNTLWIIGTLLPLPKQMSWKSKEVEALIDESQEVIVYGGFSQRPDIGWLRGALLLPAAYGAARNPDGATLQELLPGDLHDRWLVLKEKYIGGDQGIERWRPTFAVQQLRRKAAAKSGLEYQNSVHDLVLKHAKRRRLKITTPQVKQIVHVEKPRAMLKRFSKTPFADVECFATSLDRIEQDLADMRARANAWSVGDIPTLRRLTRDNSTDCINLMVNAALSGELMDEATEKEMLQQFIQQAERGRKELAEQWLATAETALANNHTTFAVLPMDLILKPDGYVAELSARGYAVEEP